MTSPYVVLRNKISRQTVEYTQEMAQQMLDHPVFGPNLEVVRVNKPEVLSGEKPEDYSGPSWSKDALVDEIDRRNTGRDEADLIDNTANKAELVTSLIADDKAAAKEEN